LNYNKNITQENNLRKILKAKVFITAAFVLLCFLSFTSNSKANYIIASLDYQVSPTAQVAVIGSYINVTMVPLNVQTTYTDATTVAYVTTTATTSYICLVGSTLPAGFPSGGGYNVYVYDGTHTWLVTQYTPNPNNASQNTLEISDSNLVAGQPVGNYYNIQFANFASVLAEPVNASTTNNATIAASFDIGTSITDNILSDNVITINGIGTDTYTSSFLVSENYQFNITNGQIVGHLSVNGVAANNDPFVAPRTISIDGIRPTIQLVNAYPNPYNPNSGLCSISYYLSTNCTVSLNILLNGTTVRTLNATGNAGNNPPIEWDGLSTTGVLQTDGQYQYVIDYKDMNGNTGTTYSGTLIITTVKLSLQIMTINPIYSGTGNNEIGVIVTMQAQISNATQANLQNLGFNIQNPPGSPGGGYVGYLDYRNYPFLLVSLKLYDNSGNLFATLPNDLTPNYDDDIWFLSPQSNPSTFIGPTGNLNVTTINPNFPPGTIYGTGNYYPAQILPIDPCTIYNEGGIPPGVPAAYQFYVEGDGNLSNDWDTVMSVQNTSLGNFAGTFNVSFSWTTINPGTYVAASNVILVSKIMVPSINGIQSATASCANGVTTLSQTYNYLSYHMQPSFFVDPSTGIYAGEQGYGLSSNQSTASFIINQGNNVPMPCNAAPSIVAFSEYPLNSASLAPNTIGPAKPLIVELSDNEGSGSTNYSTIVLTGPNGTQVPGLVSWNGGTAGTNTWDVYFTPSANLSLGGQYSWMVTPVDSCRNIGTPVTFTFNIVDESIPVINSVSALSSAGQTLNLSSSTTTQVNFTVSQINATIIPGDQTTGAQVNWANSTIVLNNSSNQSVAGTLTYTANILSFIPASPLPDGNYTAIITPQSMNGYSGAYQYKFFVSTQSSSTMTYVDLSGAGSNNTTYMIISAGSASNSGIIDSIGTSVVASLITVAAVTTTSIPAPPAGYDQIGTAVTFGGGDGQFPYTLNPTLCTATLEMHFSSSDINQLEAVGLTTTALTLWMYDGAAWHQLTTAGSLISTGTDNYMQVVLSALTQPLNQIATKNVYAFMYVPLAAAAQPVFNFHNTKVFDPTKGSPAKIYLGVSSLPNIQDVKCYLFNMAGTIVRTVEYKSNPALFSGFDVNTNNNTNNYYFAWDGKNDNGSFVRNGIYVLKMEIDLTNGSSQKIGRTIAVIK